MADTHPRVTSDTHLKAAMEVILLKEAMADTHLKDMRSSRRRVRDLVRQVVRRLDWVGV
jgi:hypothetical protein